MKHIIALRPFAFPAWVMAFALASILWPAAFETWGRLDLRVLILPLLQVIMFGMGTTLSIRDFARVIRQPTPVLVGVALQFTVMPLVGYTIAMGLGFSPEIAAGIILVGCVSGGVSSNLITYLAGGNLALSVTMTACSTIASPFMTPLLMRVLAGQLVPIDVTNMMLEILNLVIVPLAAGLVGHRVLYGPDPGLRRSGPLVMIIVASVLFALAGTLLPVSWRGLRNGWMIGFCLIGMVALAKLVIEVGLRYQGRWMDRALSLIAMGAICFIIAIIIARSRESLLGLGPLLILAALLHNGIGYLTGYGFARLIRFDERTCRTMAIEVGMQNSGMASGLAISVLKSAEAALPAALFGPVMNVTGSLLATVWRDRSAETRDSSVHASTRGSGSEAPAAAGQ